MADYRIWMPLKFGDFYRATSGFTCEETGAYTLLIMHYWQRGPLPNNDRTLARITKLSYNAWRVHFGNLLLRDFILVDHEGTELWHLESLDAEIQRAEKIAGSSQLKAKRAAILRWNGPPKTHA